MTPSWVLGSAIFIFIILLILGGIEIIRGYMEAQRRKKDLDNNSGNNKTS